MMFVRNKEPLTHYCGKLSALQENKASFKIMLYDLQCLCVCYCEECDDKSDLECVDKSFFDSSIWNCFGYSLTPSTQTCATAKVANVLERRTLTMRSVKMKLQFWCTVDVPLKSKIVFFCGLCWCLLFTTCSPVAVLPSPPSCPSRSSVPWSVLPGFSPLVLPVALALPALPLH